jgi:adhesin/invasin
MKSLSSGSKLLLTCLAALAVSFAVACQSDSPAGTAAVATIAPYAGDNQTDEAGHTVPVSPAVILKDVNGNPVAGVTVNFVVVAGEGVLTAANAVSNSSGIATVGTWTVGTTAGIQKVQASVPAIPTPVVFAATVTHTTPASIALHLGNGQSAPGGDPVAVPPSVFVADQYGNGVDSFPVTFVVATGGGSVAGASVISAANGIATVGSWTLGAVAGSNTLTVTSAGLTGSPVTFTALGTYGAAASIARYAGDAQSATVGTAVAIPPAVIVKDAHGNPVNNFPVTFVVATGGGTVTGAVTATNSDGIATMYSWSMGPLVGPNTLTVTATGLTGSPVTFNATGTVGPAYAIAARSGGGQTAFHSTAVASAPSVRVTDQYGNPVSGIAVDFAIGSGGGSLTGGSATTDVNGVAAVGSWTLGDAVGANTLTATSGTLSGSPVVFTAASVGGPATRISAQSSQAQVVRRGTNVPAAPTVLVRDAAGNPVQGVTVYFQVTLGGGTIGANTTIVTNASGIAAADFWTLGPSTGPNTLVAMAPGLTGTPVTFGALGTP